MRTLSTLPARDRRFRLTRRSLALAALFTTITGLDGVAAPASRAGNMVIDSYATGQRNDIKLSIPGEMLPKKGIVFAFGSVISSDASWELVDFDRHTVTATHTNFDRRTKTAKVLGSRSVSVNNDALSVVVALADNLWNSKTAALPDPADQKPPIVCTDISNDLILFDGERALHYTSLCGPTGVAGDIRKWIWAQLGNSGSP